MLIARRFLPQKNSTLNKVLSNISWLASDKMLEWGLTLFIGIWMARYLGPDALGQLNYALAFIALFIPFAQLGLTTIVVRSIVESPDDSAEILGTAFVLQLFSGIALGTFIVYFAWFLRPAEGLIPWFIVLLTSTILFRVTDTIKWWNQSQVSSKYTVWATRTGMIIAIVIKLALILSAAPLQAFIWAWVIQAAATAVLLATIYQRTYGSIGQWHFRLERAKMLLANSWPLIFTGFASIIYLKIDKIMIGDLASTYDVGIYSAASRISELWYFIPTIILGSLFPAIIRSRELDKTAYMNRIQALIDCMAIYSLIVAIGITIFAPYIVQYLYGEKFLSSIPILRVHAWALLFVATGVARNRWLIAENHTRFIMFATVLGAVVNVGMNWVLIPQYAGLGAAWATVISYGISTFIACTLWPPMWPTLTILSKSYLVVLRPKPLINFVSEILKRR